jgi:hypothetical protein
MIGTELEEQSLRDDLSLFDISLNCPMRAQSRKPVPMRQGVVIQLSLKTTDCRGKNRITEL